MAIPSKNVLGNPNVTEGNFQIAIEQLRESVIGSGKTYDSANTYMAYDICYYSGVVYYSKINNNIGNTPSIGANWGDYADLLSGVVHKTGDETIAGVKTFSDGIKLQNQNVSPFSGFKNYIINGNFNVDQYQIGVQSNWSSYYCYTDRFLVLSSSTVVRNGSGNNNPTGFTNHLSVTKTAGADTQIIQRWEIPKDKAKMFLNGRTLTFSCWVLSDVNNFIEHMFFIKSGTTANAYEVKEFSITKNNTANIWTRITATISNIQWTYEEGDYIEIRLDPAESIAGSMHTTGWQLEEGSVATPFEQRPYGLELSLCQRYYEKVDSYRCNIPVYGTGTGFIGSVKYKVPKRAIPTVSLGTTSHWRTLVINHGVALSTLNIQEGTAYGFDVNGTSSGGNITAGYAGKIQVMDGYTDNGNDGIFASAEL